MVDQSSPPAALLAEAAKQKHEEIKELERELTDLIARPLLAPHEQTLIFRPDHPRWARLAACTKAPAATDGAIQLTPYPNKQSWAWRMEIAGWEFYISYEDVYRAFED